MLTACASGLSVRTDYNPSADFSNYRSFGFFNPMGIEGGNNSAIYGEHYRAAISNELKSRGYRASDEPDLLVNVTFRVDDKVRMTSYTRPYMSGAYYGRPGGATYGSSLGVGVAVGSRATETTEVSVFIDLVDTETRTVSWQGVTVVKADDKVAKRLRDAIFTSVNSLFKQYPYTAGR
jgi:hypothetical protein